MKKILIVYAPYGSGHESIAKSIKAFFDFKDKYEVKILDIAKYANLFGKFSIVGYEKFMQTRPIPLWTFIYKAVDNKIATLSQFSVVKKAYDNKKIRKEIMDFNPDLTISSHFYASNLVAYYNKIGLINSKIMTIITDYTTHSSWRKDHIHNDAYIVGNQIVKNELVNYGIDANKIYPFGLPFNKEKKKNIISKDEIINRYYLDESNKTFLFFGGGKIGNRNNFEYLKYLIKCNLPINIIFVSGKNKKMEDKCRSYVVKNNVKNVKIIGFTTEVFSLLNACDVVITKAGGATITECMDMHKPMILIPGNGGPEKYNDKFIVKEGFGIKVNSAFRLSKVIKKMLLNDEIIINMTKKLQASEENNSLEHIFELSEKLLKI